MTLVVIVVLTVFIASFVTMTPFLDFVCCSASRYWEISATAIYLGLDKPRKIDKREVLEL